MTLDETNLDLASVRMFQLDLLDNNQAAGLGRVPYFGMRQSAQLEALTSRATAVASMRLSQWLLPESPWSVVGAFGLALDPLLSAVLLYVPLSYPWMHEEWHRAVLAHNGISSYDTLNSFPFFQTLIPVNQVLDSDLVRLKATAPRDLVRLEEAGYEAQTYKTFFAARDSFAAATAQVSALGLMGNFLSVLQNSLYLVTSTLPMGDEETTKLLAAEGTEIALRDFTGLDFTGWVYDLSRPEEPYDARGTHPSGVGINRYRLFSQLSLDEQAFLILQSRLSFLNFVNPFLIGINYFDFATDTGVVRANVLVQHYLTSFGSQTNVVALLADGPLTLDVVLHANTNARAVFPGLSAELYRVPLGTGEYPLKATLRGSVWFQPENLSFTTTRPEIGGSLGADLFVPLFDGHWTVISVDAKSAGWQASVLDQGAAFQAGVSWAFEF